MYANQEICDESCVLLSRTTMYPFFHQKHRLEHQRSHLNVFLHHKVTLFVSYDVHFHSSLFFIMLLSASHFFLLFPHDWLFCVLLLDETTSVLLVSQTASLRHTHFIPSWSSYTSYYLVLDAQQVRRTWWHLWCIFIIKAGCQETTFAH